MPSKMPLLTFDLVFNTEIFKERYFQKVEKITASIIMFVHILRSTNF